MKNIYLLKKIKSIKFLWISALMLVLYACVDNGDGWDDARYSENFTYQIYHTNPLTGLDYTDDELLALSYDPSEEEKYAEGQMIDLSIVSQKQPKEIKVISGVDLSIITVLSEFSPLADGFKSSNFISTLEDLGLLEIGDKTTLKFDIKFIDGSIGAVNFEIKRVKFFDPNAVIDTFVYLKSSSGEIIPLRIDESVTSRISNAAVGSEVVVDGASDKVEVQDVPELSFRGTESFSVGIWVNTTSTGNDPVIIGDKDWGSGSNPGFLFALTGGDWKLNLGDGSNRVDIGGGVINDGEWHYLMATVDRSGDVTLYQDGVSQGSASMGAIGNMTSGYPIQIAQDGTGSYGLWYEGKVGNAMIYDYVLTPQQVANISSVPTGAQLRSQDGTVSSIAVTNSGGVTSSEENRFTFDFDGSTKAAWSNGSELDFRNNGDFTIATWVKTSATNSDPSMIGDKDWGSGSNKGFLLAFIGGDWKLNAGDGSNRIDITGGIINDEEWHLIAATFDRDGNATIYQDGAAVGSTDMSAIGDMNSGLPIHLAEDGTGNYGPFTGKLANSMLFDYVVTAEEMLAIYNE